MQHGTYHCGSQSVVYHDCQTGEHEQIDDPVCVGREWLARVLEWLKNLDRMFD